MATRTIREPDRTVPPPSRGSRPQARPRRWGRQAAVLLACAAGGVALGLFLVSARGAEPHALAYTQEGGAVALEGVSAANPLLLDVAGCGDSPACFYLAAKAQLGQVDLRGIVASPAHAACAEEPCDAELSRVLRDLRHFSGLLERYGWDGVPGPTPAGPAPLREPASGDISDTEAVASAGSELIVREARQASPERPLLIATTWPGTTVATAYLTAPDIADSVVVAVTGAPAEGDPADSAWAARILAERLPTVIADPPPDPAAAPEGAAARLRRALPSGELRDALLAQSRVVEGGDLVGDAAFGVSLYRPLAWRGVEEREGVLVLTDFDLDEAVQELVVTVGDPALHDGRTPEPDPPPPPPAPQPEPTTTPALFSASVNFGPADSQAPPGYVMDTGKAFGDRGGGLRYGWDKPVAKDMRERNLHEDQRYDTLAHFAKDSDRVWEIEVPDGVYDVRLAAGDPQHTDQVNRLEVEGILFADGKADHFDTRSGTVEVADGRLTIRPASGASNPKVCFVKLSQLLDP